MILRIILIKQSRTTRFCTKKLFESFSTFCIFSAKSLFLRHTSSLGLSARERADPVCWYFEVKRLSAKKGKRNLDDTLLGQ